MSNILPILLCKPDELRYQLLNTKQTNEKILKNYLLFY